MTFYDLFLYIALAVAVAYGIYLIAERVRNHKRRDAALPKKAVSEKVVMLCQYSDQRLRLNAMALEAVREMSAAAAKKTVEKTR